MKEKLSNKEFVVSVFKFNITYILIAIINILIIPILTRTFSVEEYGFIGLYASASAFFAGFLSLGFTNGYVRFFNEPPTNIAERDIRVRCYEIPTVISVLFFTFVLILFPKLFVRRVLGTDSVYVLLIFSINVVLTYSFLFIPLFYRMRMDPKRYAIVQIISSFLTKASVLLCLLFNKNEITISFFLMFGLLIYFMFFAISHINELSNCIKIAFTKRNKSINEMYLFSLSTWPTTIMLYANTFLSQNAIINVLDKEKLGIYSALSVFVGIITAIKGGFTTFWSAYIYKYYKNDQKRIRKVQDIVMFLITILLIIIMANRDVIFLLVGRNYYEGKKILLFVLSYSIFFLAAETTLYGINLAKKPFIISIVSVVSVLVNIVGIYSFSTRLDLYGVGLSSMISGVIFFAACSILGNRYYRMIESINRTCFSSMIIIVSCFTNYYVNEIGTLLIMSAGLIIIECLVYWKMLLSVCNIKKLLTKRG